jgi:hypothetical protein
MTKLRIGLAVLATTGALVGCGGSSETTSAVTGGPADSAGLSKIQVVHASPDAPSVNVLAGGAALIEGLDYAQSSSALPLDAGTYDLAVEAIIPGGNATVIDLPGFEVQPNVSYTAVAVGKVADGTLDTLLFANDLASLAEGQARAFVVHASPSAPTVDVYVTAPGAELAQTNPLGTFSFGESLGPVDVAAGTYQIRVTAAGNPSAVVFDSGSVSLGPDTETVLTAVPYLGPGNAPICLVAGINASGGFASAELFDQSTPANLRVVHASPDAPAVDIVVNDNFSAPLVPNLTFPDFTSYVGVAADQYNVKVVDAATQGFIALDFEAALQPGREYSVIATDFLANIQGLILEDNNRRIATQAKVRLVHASPSAGNVDIYVNPVGGDLGAPAFEDVPFLANTGYVALPQGQYDVTLTAPDSLTPAATVTIDVVNFGVYTATARDAVGGGGFGLILKDDFQN